MRLHKPGKKQIIIAASVVLVLATAGTSYALMSSQTPKDNASRVSQVAQPEQAKNEVKEAETTQPNNSETAPAPVVASEPAPTPPAPQPQPIYGKDPNTSMLVVFDHATVLTQAGVPADQQQDAQTLISSINISWQYGTDSTNIEGDNICRALPDAKAQSAGADYETNPITQLKWCQTYVTARYGTWSAALAAYQGHHSF